MSGGGASKRHEPAGSALASLPGKNGLPPRREGLSSPKSAPATPPAASGTSRHAPASALKPAASAKEAAADGTLLRKDGHVSASTHQMGFASARAKAGSKVG